MSVAEPAAATTTPPARSLPLWVATIGAAAALGIVGATLTHALLARGPAAPALPELHGQVTWAPGARPAPAPSLRGRTAVVAFLGGCRACVAQLRRLVRLMPAAGRPAIVLPPASRAAAYGVSPGHRVVLLLDRNGDERTGYALPYAPAFLVGDLRTLATEGSR